MMDPLELASARARTKELAALLCAEYPEDSVGQRVISYLAEHALGRENAVPLGRLEGVAGASRGKIQNEVVVPSRHDESPLFICSCADGIFLPVTAEDIAAMEAFYVDRIASETHHLENLRKYAEALISEVVP